jgi:hypothetical protein
MFHFSEARMALAEVVFTIVGGILGALGAPVVFVIVMNTFSRDIYGWVFFSPIVGMPGYIVGVIAGNFAGKRLDVKMKRKSPA